MHKINIIEDPKALHYWYTPLGRDRTEVGTSTSGSPRSVGRPGVVLRRSSGPVRIRPRRLPQTPEARLLAFVAHPPTRDVSNTGVL